MQQIDQPSQPLGFLKDMFKKLEDFREENTLKYTLALEVFKNSLYSCKKIYGLEIQLKLN